MTQNPFVRASRKNIPIKLAFRGPSGSGKTMSALRVAVGLVGKEGKIALIDTENSSASMYAGIADFDTVTLGPPFNPTRYTQLIHAAEEAGYDCLIIDSISHAWSKEGGVLDIKDKLDAGQKVSGVQGKTRDGFGNWRHANKFQEPLIDAILQSKMHVICTMRTKTDWVIESVQTETGVKNVPKKLGLAPIQRDDVEYEFSIVFDVDGKTHVSNTSKDRSGLFDEFGEIITEQVGIHIRQWLDGGAVPVEEVSQSITPPAETNGTPIATQPAVTKKPTPKPEPKKEETLPEMAFMILKRDNLENWDALTTPTYYLYKKHKDGKLEGEEGETIMATIRVAKTEQECFDGRKRRVAEILDSRVLSQEDDLPGPVSDENLVEENV